MNHSISFIVGRDPFQRLVSAYRDKIVNSYRGSEHDVIAKVCINDLESLTWYGSLVLASGC